MWNAVRTTRRDLLGDDGEELCEDEVPESLRDLLPYASMLATGEEGALTSFWCAMDDETKAHLVGLVVPRITALNELGSRAPRSPTRSAFADLVRIMDVSDWIGET